MTSNVNSAVIYHEKQSRQMCAVHTLNNLFQQRDAFTKTEMDEICLKLSPEQWINPHRSVLGLGNYDVNVIMTALQRKGLEAVWFDKRKDPSCLQLQHIFGFVLNVPTEFQLGFLVLPIQRRHWISIRKINDLYYNLDSKLESPMVIGQDKQLISYLSQELNLNDKELFVVITAENSDKWMKESNETKSNNEDSTQSERKVAR